MTNRFNSPLLGLDLSGRSPFSAKSAIGLPPAHSTPPVIRFVAGVPQVRNVPLARQNKTAQDYLFNPPSNGSNVQGGESSKANANFNAQYYGDSGSFAVALVAGVPQLVLKRPAATRVELLIQNLAGAGIVAYAFDNVPAIANSINIAAGGNRLWDSAVPQGDLQLISSANLTVVVEFINKDLTNPNT